jgi:transcriptional regulator with XRE-family HTH domain
MHRDFLSMTPEQMRGARAMIGWGVRELAAKAGVTPNTISRLENGGDAKASTLAAIRQALEAGGVVFIPENGGGAGVRVRRTPTP